MNLARKGSASCAINGAVYVFCGFGADTMPLNSVEMLADAGSSIGLLESWKLIYIPEAVLSPRWLPAATALNENEIVITGGCTYLDDEIECLGDVILFNIESEQAQKVIKNYAGLLQFCAPNNQIACVDDNTIVCFGENLDDQEGYIVEYKKGGKML